MAKRTKKLLSPKAAVAGYDAVLGDIAILLESSRRAAARSVNSVMTLTYWEVGRRIVEFEQRGEKRAEYGTELLNRLGTDLTKRFGRGFSGRSLRKMRAFYESWRIWPTVSAKSLESPLAIRQTVSGEYPEVAAPQQLRPIWPTASAKTSIIPSAICQTSSGKSTEVNSPQSVAPIRQTASAESSAADQSAPIPQTLSGKFTSPFPLPWSHYVRLLSVKNEHARHFYEQEAVRGGWSIRQLERQINSQFYERTALSKNKAAMLVKGQEPRAEDLVTPEQEIKDPVMSGFRR